MNFSITQNNGLTIRCLAARDSIILDFTTDYSEFSVNFERTTKVIIKLQLLLKFEEVIIDSFGITHRMHLEEYPSDYKLTLDGQVFRLSREIVEQLRYLVNNIWRIE